jgi:Folylpolyglutamate synthase
LLSYDALIQQLNTAMLAGNDDRVGLLKRVLARLGHPDQDFKIVHIAGTNGKGSTGTLVAHLLQNQGYVWATLRAPL